MFGHKFPDIRDNKTYLSRDTWHCLPPEEKKKYNKFTIFSRKLKFIYKDNTEIIYIPPTVKKAYVMYCKNHSTHLYINIYKELWKSMSTKVDSKWESIFGTCVAHVTGPQRRDLLINKYRDKLSKHTLKEYLALCVRNIERNLSYGTILLKGEPYIDDFERHITPVLYETGGFKYIRSWWYTTVTDKISLWYVSSTIGPGICKKDAPRDLYGIDVTSDETICSEWRETDRGYAYYVDIPKLLFKQERIDYIHNTLRSRFCL